MGRGSNADVQGQNGGLAGAVMAVGALWVGRGFNDHMSLGQFRVILPSDTATYRIASQATKNAASVMLSKLRKSTIGFETNQFLFMSVSFFNLTSALSSVPLNRVIQDGLLEGIP